MLVETKTYVMTPKQVEIFFSGTAIGQEPLKMIPLYASGMNCLYEGGAAITLSRSPDELNPFTYVTISDVSEDRGKFFLHNRMDAAIRASN